MYSIGNKIRIAIILSISIVAIFALIMLSVSHQDTVNNQQIIETMTTEYSIISQTNTLTQAYNSVIKSPGTAQNVSEYDTIHKRLLTTLSTLKNQITNPESKALMIGVENTVNQVIAHTDEGVAEVKKNNFENISTHFNEAQNISTFVSDNVQSLLQKELEHLSATQEASQRSYTISIITSIGIFFIIIVMMIFFAQSFSTQLTAPLKNLSLYAKNVADGNLQAMNTQELRIPNDEIGSLTTSIKIMVDKLIEMLNQQKRTNEELTRSTDTIKTSNEELMKMNSLMTGRELRMMELKKEIEILKAKIPSA